MKRNLTLDIFKLFLCILVIIIHMPSLLEDYKAFSWIFTYGITRIAVPIFFIIGGYYFSKKAEDIQILKKYLIHLCIIYTTWYLIYIPFSLEILKIDGEYRIYNMFSSFFWGYGHLWYVAALIQGSIFLYIAKRILKNDKWIIYIAIITLILATVYSLSVDPFHSSINIYRNGLFFGFPFMAIGYYSRKMDLVSKIKGSYLIPITIIAFIALLAESYNLYQTKAFSDLLFSLIILCPLLFMLVMKYSRSAYYGIYLSELPGAVYFIHKLVLILIIPVQENSLYKLPEVFIVSVLLSFIIIFVNKRIKIFL